MQASRAWCEPLERRATSKPEFWFTLIRFVIVVALIGTAARLVGIAYAPQVSAVPQQLNCPPDVVTHDEPVELPQVLAAVTHDELVVLPQVLAVTEQSATSVASGDGIANKSDVRSMIGKKQANRSGAKKPPTYALARNSVSPKRPAMGELAKRGEVNANQPQKRKALMPTLADSRISQSAFHDMHGQ
jgi:hypothetical protein